MVNVVVNIRSVTDSDVATAFAAVTIRNRYFTDSNTVISSCSRLPHSNTIGTRCTGFADSNRICSACTVVIIVSAISCSVYMEVVNLVSIQLRYVDGISICYTGDYISNLLVASIDTRICNRRTISDCQTGCTEGYRIADFDTVQTGKVFR